MNLNTRNYGHLEKLREDIRILNSIFDRQGVTLFIDIIAEAIGKTAHKFEFNDAERARVIEMTVTDLRDALNERM